MDTIAIDKNLAGASTASYYFHSLEMLYVSMWRASITALHKMVIDNLGTVSISFQNHVVGTTQTIPTIMLPQANLGVHNVANIPALSVCP
jgi:hypothetical protein